MIHWQSNGLNLGINTIAASYLGSSVGGVLVAARESKARDVAQTAWGSLVGILHHGVFFSAIKHT